MSDIVLVNADYDEPDPDTFRGLTLTLNDEEVGRHQSWEEAEHHLYRIGFPYAVMSSVDNWLQDRRVKDDRRSHLQLVRPA